MITTTRRIFFHLKSLPVQIIMLLFTAYVCVDWMPSGMISFFFALSLSLKEILIFILPFLIFMFLFLAISRMHGGIFLFVLCLLLCICGSNFVSAMISYGVSQMTLPHFPLALCMDSSNQVTTPLWDFFLPKFLANDTALFTGLILGALSGYLPRLFLQRFQEGATVMINVFLYRFFVPLVPVFIFGFVLKFSAEGLMDTLLQQCGSVLILICLLQLSYTTLLYAGASKFRFHAFVASVRNMFPALVAAGTTMSSAAALPLTISGVRLNTKHDPSIDAVVPMTTNIHLVGDSLGVPLLAMAIMLGFGGTMPTLMEYLVFAGYFVLIKFSIAGVPGGGIIVMLPLLEQCFQFSPEMGALITTLYILADPVNTAFNVFGNGAFAMLFSRGWAFLAKKHHVDSSY